MLTQFAKDRDKAFTKLVMNDDINAVVAFAKKYGTKLPKD